MSSGGSHYDVLGVKHDASTTEIMNAYNSKVQKVPASAACWLGGRCKQSGVSEFGLTKLAALG